MTTKDLVRGLLVKLGLVPKPDLYVRIVELHPSPEEIKQGQAFIVGNTKIRKWICFQCPDGCGEMIHLSLISTTTPHWSISVDWLGQPTVFPSVRKLDGCKSHFWIKTGKIDWCNDSGILT
jgi:hypothetical protein